MKKRKSILQKFSSVIGVICFFLAALSAIGLYLKVQELTMQHPVSASFLASSFFFVFIGFVFIVIGRTDIPSFKIGEGDIATSSTTLINKDTIN